MVPQFWLRPFTPKQCATRLGKTPKRMPYARPVRPETNTRKFGLEMMVATTWAKQNITADAKRHQKRERLNFETRISDPMPERRRPVKLKKLRIETCIACRFSMNEGDVEGS
jgi:hypothetical protein